MSTTIRSSRSRIAALATGLALSVALVAAPVVVAQYDSPEAAVQGFLDDIEAGNFAAIGGWFCEEFAGQADALNMSELTASLPEGLDAETVLNAFKFAVTVNSLDTVSQDDTEATVAVDASLAMEIDIPALEPVIVAILEGAGQEATPDMVEMVSGMMATEIGGESLDIAENVTVVPNEDGTWGKICSELGGDDAAMSAEMSPAASTEAAPEGSAATDE
jgi:hypothetical protein